MPDAEEIGKSIVAWESWFIDAAIRSIALTNAESVTIFYQTDRKVEGRVVSKAGLLFQAAQAGGTRILWHKICLRRDVGAIDLRRPGFSHLVAFSKAGRPGAASPDVFQPGRCAYENGIPVHVAVFSVAFAGGSGSLIIDPFCGRGTIPAAAEAMGFAAIGVDIDPEQCRLAKSMVMRRRAALSML